MISLRIAEHSNFAQHTRNLSCQGEEGGVVGHVAAGEDKTGFLLMKLGELILEVFVHHRVSGNVPGSSRASSVVVNGIPNMN